MENQEYRWVKFSITSISKSKCFIQVTPFQIPYAVCYQGAVGPLGARGDAGFPGIDVSVTNHQHNFLLLLRYSFIHLVGTSMWTSFSTICHSLFLHFIGVMCVPYARTLHSRPWRGPGSNFGPVTKLYYYQVSKIFSFLILLNRETLDLKDKLGPQAIQEVRWVTVNPKIHSLQFWK